MGACKCDVAFGSTICIIVYTYDYNFTAATDLEAVQQYEKMLAIEATVINAEPDVKVEHITGVSYDFVSFSTISINFCISNKKNGYRKSYTLIKMMVKI